MSVGQRLVFSISLLSGMRCGSVAGGRALRRDEGEAAQANVEVLDAYAVAPGFLSEYQAHFGALVYEVGQERGGERDAAFKTGGGVLLVRAAHHLRVERDGHAALIFGGELAHRQAT